MYLQTHGTLLSSLLFLLEYFLQEYFQRWSLRSKPLQSYMLHNGLPVWPSSKKSTCKWVEKIPWSRKWKPTPVFLPGKFPWREEPGELQSRESQTAGHGWATQHTHILQNSVYTHSNDCWIYRFSVLFFQQYQTLSHYFFVSRILIEMSDVNLILLYSPSFFLEPQKYERQLHNPFPSLLRKSGPGELSSLFGCFPSSTVYHTCKVGTGLKGTQVSEEKAGP